MRVLYLFCGAPGSGKSTIGERVAPGRSIAADDWRYNDAGEYVFDPLTTASCHASCLQKAVDLMADESGADVAVCNTFTKVSERRKYVEAARRAGYAVILCQTVGGDFDNVHNVPDVVVRRMRQDFQGINYSEIT